MLELNPRESYGQLSFVDNTIESTSGEIDIQIGLVESTADLKLNRNTVLAAGKTFGLVDVILDIPATLSAEDGVIVVDGAEGIQVGDIKIFQDTIESSSPGTDIQLGNIDATADLVLNRNTVLATGKSLTFPDATIQTTAPVNADWDATSGLAEILNKPDIEALTNISSVRYSPVFSATDLIFTGSGSTYPTYNSHYVKQGQLVSFWIAIDLATVTNFGTGQLKVDLPFAPLAGTMNHFPGWVFVDEAANPDLAGHIILNIDHLPNTQTLDLHYIKQQGGANSPVMEAVLKQGSPITLTTLTNIYINGTYISA